MGNEELIATARRAKGNDLLPKVSFGVLNAETLILRLADALESAQTNHDAIWFEATAAAHAALAELFKPEYYDTERSKWACEYLLDQIESLPNYSAYNYQVQRDAEIKKDLAQRVAIMIELAEATGKSWPSTTKEKVELILENISKEKK